MATIQEMISAAVERKAIKEREQKLEVVRYMRHEESQKLKNFRGWVGEEIAEALGEITVQERAFPNDTIYVSFTIDDRAFCAYPVHEGWRVFLPSVDHNSQIITLDRDFGEEFLLALGRLLDSHAALKEEAAAEAKRLGLPVPDDIPF